MLTSLTEQLSAVEDKNLSACPVIVILNRPLPSFWYTDNGALFLDSVQQQRIRMGVSKKS